MGEGDQVTEDDRQDPVQFAGRIKWFNAVKGFGFITPGDGQGDVFIHLSALRQAGYEGIEQGATVVCEAVRGPKGWQAVRVIEVDTSTAEAPAEIQRSDTGSPDGGRYPSMEPEGDFFEVAVKWFNADKGYGFVTQGEGTQDIFLHIKMLRRVGLDDLRPGQTLMVRTGQGPKGPQVAEIDTSSL
jgi:CspA family cold shock protein|tara:strand:+ start:299 stop:853 length:555 start_codon:yes stop_codon:yes gene_type:complete